MANRLKPETEFPPEPAGPIADRRSPRRDRGRAGFGAPGLGGAAAVACALAVACGGDDGPPDDPMGPDDGEPNRPPVARVELEPSSGPAPLTVRIDGGASSDPEGPIADHRWAFGDGVQGSGASVEHTYEEVGMYVVRLTVRDEDGAEAVARDSVFVEAPAGDGDHRIQGTVWHDVDADGERGVGEPGAPGVTVFLDEDGSGALDPGEVATVSGQEGAFSFEGLEGDRSYTVTQALTLGWTNTHPGAPTDGESVAAPTPPRRTAGPSGPARIVQGSEVEHTAFPFMVTLLAAAEPNNRKAFFCGGTLISGFWVLTAGHCVDNPVRPEDLAVLVGTGDLTEGGERVGVERIRIEPTFFNEAGFDNDMAVLKLERRVMLPRIDVMDPPREDLAQEGDTAVAVGWGRLGQDEEISVQLRAVEMPIFDQTVCQNLFELQTRAIICGGREGGGPATCFGDSGGPLAVQGPHGRWIEIGVTSFTLNCGQSLPSGFTRVAPLAAFIREVTEPERSGSHVVDWTGGSEATVEFGNFR